MIFNYTKDTGFTNIFQKKELTFDYDVKQFEKVRQIMIDTGMSIDEVAKSMDEKISPAIVNYAKEVPPLTMTQEGLNKSVQNSSKAFSLMSVKSKLAAVGIGALNAVATMGISLLASVVIGDVITFFDDLYKSSEEIAESIKSSTENINELTNAFTKQKQTVTDIGKRYAELSQGVNQFTGANKSLSTESYNEFLSLGEQLYEVFPSLPVVFDDNGRAIVQLSGDVDTIIGSLQQFIDKERELANIQIENELPNLFDNVLEQSKRYNASIEEMKVKRDSLLTDTETFNESTFLDNFLQGINDRYLKITSKNSEQYSKMVNDYIAILDNANIEYALTNDPVELGGFDEFGNQEKLYESHINIYTEFDTIEAEESLKTAIGDLAETYAEEVVSLNEDINSTIENNQSNWSSLTQGLLSWVSKEDSYQILSDEVQTVIQTMINGIDYTNLDFSSMDELREYIQNNILNIFDGSLELPNELEQKVVGLFDQGNLSDDSYIALVKSIVAEVQQYIDDAELDFEFDLNFLISDKEDVKTRVKNFVNQIGGTVEQYKLNQYMVENGIDTQAEREQFLIATESATTYLEAIELYEKYLADLETKNPPALFSQENNTQIDAFQEKVEKVNGYLQGLKNRTLSSNDVLDIIQEMNIDPSTIDMSTNAFAGLKEKLEEIVNIEFTNMQNLFLGLLKDGTITEEEYNNLMLLIQSFKDVEVSSLSSGLSELQSSYNALKGAQDEATSSNKLSLETIQNLANEYPELENTLMDYLSGVTDTSSVIEALKEAYDTDLQNYYTYVASKKGEDTNFYDTIRNSLSDDLVDRADHYGLELLNYKSYNEAKLAMEKKYQLKKVQLMLKTDMYEAAENDINKDPLNTSLYAARDDAQEKVNQAQKELLDLEKIINDFDTTVDFVMPTFATNLNHSYGTEDKFSEEIDWIAQSVENAQKKVDDLDRTLSQTKGFTDRLSVYEKLNEANGELVTATEDAASEYKKIWESKITGIDPKYVELITGDRASLKIENFDNEEEYNKVMELVDAYDMWQSAEVKNQDALEKKKSDQDAINSLYLEQAELNLDILNAEDQSTMTVKEKNAWLEKEKLAKAEILKYDLLLIDSEEERLLKEKEYAQYLAKNAEDQYQNLRTERSERAGYFGTRIQDIQNDIDLQEAQGGQGTAEQYEAINSFLDDQIAVYQIDYEEALAKRNEADPRTDLWYQYNKEVQEAQDNINACKIAQIENNKAIALLPVKYYEDLNKELERELETVTKNREEIETAIGYASTYIQNEIDLLNKHKEARTEYYEGLIKPLQEQKDALTENNDEIQRAIDLENAKYNLEKARNNKTVRIYRKGSGFVYEADQDEVRAAQNELDSQVRENEIANLDNQINSYNKQQEDEFELIDEDIKTWEDYAEKIDKVNSSFDEFLARQTFVEQFGADAITKLASQSTSLLYDFGVALNSVKLQESELENAIANNDLIIQAIQVEAEAYVSGAQTIVEAREKIDAIVKANEDEIAAMGVRTGTVTTYNQAWSNTQLSVEQSLKMIEQANIAAKDMENTILTERLNNLEIFKNIAVSYYKDIAKALSSAQSSFNQIQSLVSSAQSAYAEVLNYVQKANSAKASISTSSTSSNKNGTKLPTKNNHVYAFQSDLVDIYHDGGIVGKTPQRDIPEHLIALTDSNLKPNETFAKLLNGEVVLNPMQMGNMFNNLSRAYSAITPLNKRESSPVTVSIGDVNVYSPDNTDMIVNEIVKELPLKVVQRLHSK